jgi:hypothetical protein
MSDTGECPGIWGRAEFRNQSRLLRRGHLAPPADLQLLDFGCRVVGEYRPLGESVRATPRVRGPPRRARKVASPPASAHTYGRVRGKLPKAAYHLKRFQRRLILDAVHLPRNLGRRRYRSGH